MNRIYTNALFAMVRCVKSTVRLMYILKGMDSTRQILNNDTPFDQHLCKCARCVRYTQRLERPKRSTRTASRIVRGVALVIGITLFLPVEQVSNAQVMPNINPKHYAKWQLSTKEYRCLNKLWSKESAWNHKADNPHSTAFGIPQLLKMTETDPLKQVDLGIKYIRHRYDNACNAWSFHLKRNWY
jgi:hypothetical protein